MDDPEFERFRENYELADHPVVTEIEQAVLGTDYGANGYTTRDQADLIGARLELGPETTLLDTGTGCGWPGVYLAKTTGCRAVLTDVPIAGLQRARARIDAEGLTGRVGVVASNAQHPPFRRRGFGAICHTDVLC